MAESKSEIAERKRVEEDIELISNRLLVATKAGAIGIWDYDILESTLVWDEQMYRLYGISQDRFSGAYEAWEEGLHPDDLVAEREKLQRAIRGEAEFDTEFRVVWPDDGSIHYITANATVLHDESGQAVRMIGTNRDFTKRKRADEELALISNRLLVATKAGAIGIWDYDIVENRLVWDEQMYRIYGVPQDRFSGAYEAWEGVLHPDDLVAEREKLQSAIRGETEFDTEFRVVWPDDGSIHFIKANATVLHDESGQGVRVIGTNWDNTERRRTEEDLRLATKRAEAAVHAKSDFLANMSHEIRTPMNGIIGMTELLLDTELSESQREYQVMVRNSAESLLTILNDILDFSKIESGKLALDRHPFRLHDLIGDTLQPLGIRAAEKNLELISQIHPDVPEALEGDAGRLQQILLNLVGNAIKFTEAGEVVVDVRLDSHAGDSYALHFRVHDTGLGVSPEKQELIFESFTQAESSTTRRFGGTGLGLSISRQLVELMQGRIWVESVPGSGSTFHFTLVLPRARENAFTDEASPPPDFTGKRALVVDDNATNRKILEGMLLGWNIISTLHESGAEAVDLLTGPSRDDTFDLIILDYMMPGMDGLEAAKRIHESLGDEAPPILMLASTDVLLESETLRSVGIERQINKPAKGSDLRDAISLLFGNSQQRRGTGDGPSKPTEGVAPMNVLVAEDGKINQVLATRILEKRGHSVSIAENGREALALLASESFDAVLMDVQMPEMNGLEATSAIREREAQRGGHVPIIAMTANAMKGDREICLAAGMDDYVAKPVRAESLLAAVEKFSASPGETQRELDALHEK